MEIIKLNQTDITVSKKETINVNMMTNVTIPIDLFIRIILSLPTNHWQARRQDFINSISETKDERFYSEQIEQELTHLKFNNECKELLKEYNSFKNNEL